jgi:hypothetical protein
MRFSEGARVRTIVENPSGHTRLPAYLQGREGRIERLYAGLPQGLYTVIFDARDVWGKDAPANVSISADLAEGYLNLA